MASTRQYAESIDTAPVVCPNDWRQDKHWIGFFFSSRRLHTRYWRDWSSDVCSSDLEAFGDGSAWDAVLLDQRMPGMDGLETLRHINERDATARVIMATAYASIELAVDAMKLGATDFVRKPMTPEILRNAVAAALAKQPRVTAPDAPTSAEISAEPLIQIITMN